MQKISLKNLVWKEGKYYVSQALNMEISSFGKTRKEAIRNLLEAIALYLEDTPRIKMREVSRPVVLTNIVRYA